MKRLIECVPNFSEGRDLAKVDAIVDALSGIPECVSTHQDAITSLRGHTGR